MRRTIPYRENLTADIFEEMTENYPLIAVDGREYKQELKYYSFPSDFKFVKFRFDCKSNDVDTGNALCVLSYLMAQMCVEHGYYCIYSDVLLYNISKEFDLSEEQCKTIIDALIEMGYLYNFDGRLTCIIVVRTFECVQSTRISNRTRRKPSKTDENAPIIDERPDSREDTPAPAETPKKARTIEEIADSIKEGEVVEPPEMDDEELKFFEEQEKKDGVEFQDITQDDNFRFKDGDNIFF